MKQDGGIFWGKMIVGTSTLMFVFVLISGVVVWWPRTRKALKNSLKIVANKGWRRFWYDLHVAGGMYALVFLLAMALTGLTWSFQWYRTGFYKTFGVEVQPSMGHGNAAANATAKGGKRDGKPERWDVLHGIFHVLLHTLASGGILQPYFTRMFTVISAASSVIFDGLVRFTVETALSRCGCSRPARL